MTLAAIARRALDRARLREMAIVAQCMREAREHVHRRHKTACAPIPRVSLYGTTAHNTRRRYDAAVHDEFHRRLKAAGVHVEGA